MVNMALYDHAMQKPCKKNDSIYFCANFDFFQLKIDFVDFLFKVLTLLTFSNKCKIVKKNHGAKLGYDSCPYLISLDRKNANNLGIRILAVKDN